MEEKNKEQENNESKNNFKDNITSLLDIINTTFAPLKALIKIHYKLAVKELKRDSRRFFSAIFSILTGLFFLGSVWILLNVLAILAFYEFLQLKLFYSVLIVSGINLFFAIILFLINIPKLKKPMLSETKKIIKETIQELENK